MKIKLHTPSGFWDDSKQLVIDSTKIDSMIGNDNGGTDILMNNGEKFVVRETVDEIITAYTPTLPLSQPAPQPPAET